MIEILFVCLVIWFFYAWKTGKFSKEYQDKNNAELKQSFKTTTKVITTFNDRKPHHFLNIKQKNKLKAEREKHAEILAKKFNTRSSALDEKLKEQAKKDYEYTLKLRNKTIHSDSDSRSYDLEDELPVISLYANLNLK